MAVSNTYIEPTTGTSLNTARDQFNNSMRAILTNFKGAVAPTQLNSETVPLVEQSGMLYRSTLTNALYISDSTNKKTPAVIGGGFTRWGIGPRVETNLAALTAHKELYEIGELAVTLDTARVYFKKSATTTFATDFWDVGSPVGYSVGLNSNINFSGQSVTGQRFLATANVGIGTISPAYELDVIGNTSITGTTTTNQILSSASDYTGGSWVFTGPSMAVRARKYIDNTTPTDTVRTTRPSVSFAQPTFDTNLGTNVTITDASTVYIANAPIANNPTNVTLKNSHALHIVNGRTFLESGGSLTIPALAIRTQNTGIYSSATNVVNIITNGVNGLSIDAKQNTNISQNVIISGSASISGNATITGNVFTSILSFTGASTIKGDFNTTSGVTTTAVTNTIASNAYTPSPVGGNMKTLVNNNTAAITLHSPSAAGDYTLIIHITNGASAGVINLTGFTKITGDTFTTTNADEFLLYITKINSRTISNVVRLQ